MELATQEDLDRVAAFLRKNGWIQGTYYTAGGFCLAAAVNKVFKDQPYVLTCVRAELNERINHEGIVRWNDRKGRTFPEVLKLLGQ